MRVARAHPTPNNVNLVICPHVAKIDTRSSDWLFAFFVLFFLLHKPEKFAKKQKKEKQKQKRKQKS